MAAARRRPVAMPLRESAKSKKRESSRIAKRCSVFYRQDLARPDFFRTLESLFPSCSFGGRLFLLSTISGNTKSYSIEHSFRSASFTSESNRTTAGCCIPRASTNSLYSLPSLSSIGCYYLGTRPLPCVAAHIKTAIGTYSIGISIYSRCIAAFLIQFLK